MKVYNAPAYDHTVLLCDPNNPGVQVWWPYNAIQLRKPNEEHTDEDEDEVQNDRRSLYGCASCMSVDNPKLQYRCEKCDNDYSNWIDKNGDTCSVCKFEAVSGSDFPCVKCKDDSEFQFPDETNEVQYEADSTQLVPNLFEVGDFVRVRPRKKEWIQQFPHYDNLMTDYVGTVQCIEQVQPNHIYELKNISYCWDGSWLEKVNETDSEETKSCHNCSVSDNQRNETIENVKGETNMTMKIIETAKRTVDEAIKSGSEGIKQGAANSAATTIVKVTRNYFGESYPKVMDTELGKKAEPLALALFIHFAVGMMGDKVPKRAAIEKNCNRVITAQMSHNSEEFIEKINPFLTMLSEHIDEIPE